MQTAPMPDADEPRDNATFAAVLNALARPGTVHEMPEPGLLPVALALVDRECRVFADEAALSGALARSGASVVPPDLADHLFLSLGTESAMAQLLRAPVGSQLYPDQGATVVAPARFGDGPAVRLAGPGIRDTATLSLGELHADVWRVRAGLCRYPLGIEMIFVDGTRLVALPRSTTVTEG
ncbi:phosphonate C-P lyase system protein PhnH [Psychromarinibacter sp. C21-152]|uniref:Phosphonate C-P lyase system protein PhnH n=1 Tax=Psychromarinibacter sediminicola TaxID=3033385 RepID=A0AAE3TBL3_9RHOB|nr:phosphonate C-P lyase system protein PhnH [Psychromarinibacter sediminicola]MDF0602785.1 phosphonate C-P lyase system protein PhnH [Psychromarinibacter sediminicola]